MLVAVIFLAACAQDEQPVTVAADKPAYVTLDVDQTQLKADFNAMTDKVRLVFISGPSCGICLRGMDDLNESIVASLQNDPRAHTFVVQVPTLGAEEKHAAAAVPLMPGPRVNHYWDPDGGSGRDFQAALGIDMYAWDVWMIYEPGARWEVGSTPPAPAFWQHQLGGLPRDKRLDAEEFAAAVATRVAALPERTEATQSASAQRTDPGVLAVAQPRGVMIQQNHLSRGGYQKLKTIESIRYEGETDIDGETYSLIVETERPYRYERVTSHGSMTSIVTYDGADIVHEGDIGLPKSLQDELLASYEFDGWMTDWKAKGHQVWRLGMKKYQERLPWIMEAELTNGRTWHIYVDSHTGDAFRQALIDESGTETLAVEFDDYRDVDGFRLPHEVRYYDGARLLATDRFTQIAVTVAEADSNTGV
jgi:hypothetical protein